MVVEGAGGGLAPVDENSTMLDLMRALELPVLVAASPRMGTLNHTLLTLQALERAGLELAGVALVETVPAPWGTIEQDNSATIERMGRTRVVGALPYLAGLDTAETPPASLIRHGGALLSRL